MHGVESLAIHLGPLPSINGNASAPIMAAGLLQQFDHVVVSVPYAGTLAAPTKSADTAQFFNAIAALDRPAWFHVPMVGTFATQAVAEAVVEAAVETFADWFADADVGPAGVFLDEFGFEGAFVDGQNVTRAYQNAIVEMAHGAGLAVFASLTELSHGFTLYGPSAGDEANAELDPPALGADSFTDFVLVKNPIISTWAADMASYAPGRLPDALAAIKEWVEGNSRLRVAAAQEFYLGTSGVDALLGLTLDAATEAQIQSYVDLLGALGFPIIGAHGVGFGASDNKLIMPSHQEAVRLDIIAPDDAWGSFRSASGAYQAINRKGVHGFSSAFAYTSSTWAPEFAG